MKLNAINDENKKTGGGEGKKKKEEEVPFRKCSACNELKPYDELKQCSRCKDHNPHYVLCSKECQVCLVIYRWKCIF